VAFLKDTHTVNCPETTADTDEAFRDHRPFPVGVGGPRII